MNIPLIVSLFLGLLIVVISFTTYSQNRQRKELLKKHEIVKLTSVIRSTEELISNLEFLPLSKDLLITLHKRNINALKELGQLDHSKKNFTANRIENINQQLQTIEKDFVNSDISAFKIPQNDQEAVRVLKILRRVKTILKSEHAKGTIRPQSFVNEIKRIEYIKIRINLENVLKRSADSLLHHQPGTAIQLLQRGLVLIKDKNDPLCNKYREKINTSLQQIKYTATKEKNAAVEELNKKDELDELFQPKKKW